MFKRRINLKKVLVPSDSIALVVIVIGLLIALFISELAIRLIGVSIMILGSVALFMLISQRMSEIVESNKFQATSPPPNYHITIKQDTKAKRQTIENFEETFSPEDLKIKQTSTAGPEEYMTNEEGFRIVRKTGTDETEKEMPDYIRTETPIAIEENFEFVEEESSVKVVSKIPRKEEVEIPNVINVSEPVIEDNKISKDINEPIPGLLEETIPIPQALHEELKTTVQKPILETYEFQEKYKEKHLDIPISALIENEPIFGQEPRKEFQYFLSKALTIIRSVTITRTAAFLLVNSEKEELILESYITDTPSAITKKLKFPLGNDIVSQIFRNLKPEILTEINPAAELDLIPYYKQAIGTSSFIGVPVFYDGSIIGILCADSDVVDAYDANTVGFLGHFTKLIGSLLQSYIEKHDLMQNSRTLKAINQFRSISSNKNATIEEIIESVSEAVSSLFEYTSLGICSFDESSNKWVIKTFKTKEDTIDNLLGTSISLRDSLVGKCLVTNNKVYVSPVDEQTIRFNPNETHTDKGYFVAVPLKTFTNNYGALFVEGKSPTNMTSYDVNILETLGEHAGASLEQIQFFKVLQFSSLIDIATGLYNPPALYQRLEEELERNIASKSNFTFCLIQIDKYASFDPEQHQDRLEQVFNHIVKIIHHHIRSYDIFGRVDSTTLGAVLVGVSLSESKIWAERLRSEIATSDFTINSKRFNVTVSIGLAEVGKLKKVDELVSNAKKVLEISAGKTNCVTVFT
jgi:diguanylate cyclase (GGDEF)-like protein